MVTARWIPLCAPTVHATIISVHFCNFWSVFSSRAKCWHILEWCNVREDKPIETFVSNKIMLLILQQVLSVPPHIKCFILNTVMFLILLSSSSMVRFFLWCFYPCYSWATIHYEIVTSTFLSTTLIWRIIFLPSEPILTCLFFTTQLSYIDFLSVTHWLQTKRSYNRVRVAKNKKMHMNEGNKTLCQFKVPDISLDADNCISMIGRY